jgi:hypothetical protein
MKGRLECYATFYERQIRMLHSMYGSLESLILDLIRVPRSIWKWGGGYVQSGDLDFVSFQSPVLKYTLSRGWGYNDLYHDVEFLMI